MIYFILSIASVAVGILAFFIAAFIISTYHTAPPDSGGFEGLFMAIAGFIWVFIAVIIDLILTSILIYIFSYFSHENALAAIAELSETGGSLKLPKFLRVISIVEMIISGVAAFITLLLVMAVLAF